MSWDQAAFRGAAVNPAVDPYYVSFFDENAPTTMPAGFRNPTLDFAMDLSGSFIAGITSPIVAPMPQLVASRRGGAFLSGRRRAIPLADPYLKGQVSISPGTPEEHRALLQVAARVTGTWIVLGGAYPSRMPEVWPITGAANTGRYRRSAIFCSSIVLRTQQPLARAEQVTGAMNLDLAYEGRIAGELP